MFNLSAKKHYLLNQFKGYANEYSIIVRDIEVNENTLVLDLKVNHTDDIISRSDMMESVVAYNLINDTYTIKAIGKGSRKHAYNIKRTITIVIDHLVSEANKAFNTDCTEVRSMTVDYICNQLKEAGATTQQTNEMYYNINHTYNTILDVIIAFSKLMNELTTVKTEVIQNNQITEETYTVGNRSFSTYAEAVQYCNESDFEPELMITKEVANMQPLDNQTRTNEPEVFHLYKNTFTTYSEAYNYAIDNSIPVTMIISSLHKTMTNERLQQLEKEYVFSKSNMFITDMKEYYEYISLLPLSLDKEERYYKLKGYIQRYEYKQQSKLAAENKHQQLSIEGSRLLVFMKEKGLELKLTKDYQWYYYNSEHVYSFYSCSVEQYYNDMKALFNKYFSQYQNEYNNSQVYYYKVDKETSLGMDNYPKGWISYNNNTGIAVFNREMTITEQTYYQLIPVHTMDLKAV
jgi:hypothetical protein